MNDHLYTFFGGTPYADQSAVTSTRIFSTDGKARELEQQINQSLPHFSEIWPAIEALPAPERNFLSAVFIAWAYEISFFDALKSGRLPQEIHLAQSSGDFEFGDHFYTYEWDAATYRRLALEERLSHHQHEAKCLARQLARFDQHVEAIRPAAAVAAPADA